MTLYKYQNIKIYRNILIYIYLQENYTTIKIYKNKYQNIYRRMNSADYRNIRLYVFTFVVQNI